MDTTTYHNNFPSETQMALRKALQPGKYPQMIPLTTSSHPPIPDHPQLSLSLSLSRSLALALLSPLPSLQLGQIVECLARRAKNHLLLELGSTVNWKYI